MATEYVLSSFSTGEVIARNLPVKKGADLNDVNILTPSLEIDIVKSKLPLEAQNDWKNYFKRLARMISLVDPDKAWDDPIAVKNQGFINKVSSAVGSDVITLQIFNADEYTQIANSASAWSMITDGTAKETITAASYSGLISKVHQKAWSNEGFPADAPKRPDLIRNWQTDDGAGFSKDIIFSEKKSYRSIAEEIRDIDSGIGIEWRYVPVWRDSSKTRFAYDFIVGTSTVPHIKEDETIEIILGAAATQKISAFSTSIDSNDVYNKVIIQSKAGEETSGADLQSAWDNSDPEMPLVETVLNVSVELTQEQIDAQTQARLATGLIGGLTVSFTIEEEWDKDEWLDNVGKRVHFTDVPDTISSGHEITVRCVGISFSEDKSTIKVSFMQLQNSYPQLPRDKKKPWAASKVPNYAMPPSIPTGGGVVIPPPTGGGGVDGVFNPSDLWGSEGHNPWDQNQKPILQPAFVNFFEKEYTYSDFLGQYPMDPLSACMNEGNRVYGLDHLNQAAATKFELDGNHVHYMGGIDKANGMFLNGLKPFYIKKSYIANQELGPIQEVETITPAMIQDIFASWEDQDYGGEGYYTTMLHAANWVVNGRYYFSLHSAFRHAERANIETQYDYDNFKWFSSTRMRVISKAINNDTGLLEGLWQTETEGFIPTWLIPNSSHITRYGNNVIFNGGDYNGYYGKWKNASYQQVIDRQTAIHNVTGTYPNPPMYGIYGIGNDADFLASNYDANNWPYFIDRNSQSLAPLVRKNFGNISEDAQVIKQAPYSPGTDNPTWYSKGATLNGWYGYQGNYQPNISMRQLTPEKMNDSATPTVKPADSSAPNGLSYNVEIVSCRGNFVIFSVADDGNWANYHPWGGTIRVDTDNITTSAIVGFQDETKDKMPFWAGGYDYSAHGLYARSVEARAYWQPGDSTRREALMSPSSMFSYDGCIYKFILSAQNKLILHSAKMIESA